MLKSTEGWDQVAAFVALTMRHKMEIARERQGRPIAAATQHPMPDLAIPPPVFAFSNPATEAEDDPGQSTSETSGSQFTIQAWDPEIPRSWSIPKRRESVVTPSAQLSSMGEMGADENEKEVPISFE